MVASANSKAPARTITGWPSAVHTASSQHAGSSTAAAADTMGPGPSRHNPAPRSALTAALANARAPRSVPQEAPATFVPRAPADYVFMEDVSLPRVPRHLWGSVYLDLPWVTYDLETTGLLPDNPRILEVGCVVTRRDGSRRGFTSLVKPDIDFTGSFSTQFHRIQPEHVASAPRLAQVTRRLASFLRREAPRGFVLGGFNTLAFDNVVLRQECLRQKAPWPFGWTAHLDMQLVYRHEFPKQNIFDRRTLKHAVESFCRRTQSLAHGAKSDAIDASDVLFGMVIALQRGGMPLSGWANLYRDPQSPLICYVPCAPYTESRTRAA